MSANNEGGSAPRVHPRAGACARPPRVVQLHDATCAQKHPSCSQRGAGRPARARECVCASERPARDPAAPTAFAAPLPLPVAPLPDTRFAPALTSSDVELSPPSPSSASFSSWPSSPPASSCSSSPTAAAAESAESAEPAALPAPAAPLPRAACAALPGSASSGVAVSSPPVAAAVACGRPASPSLPAPSGDGVLRDERAASPSASPLSAPPPADHRSARAPGQRRRGGRGEGKGRAPCRARVAPMAFARITGAHTS